MLQNTSFESYDAGTLVPDNWTLLDGSVQVYEGDVYDGAVSIYSLGGTAERADEDSDWVITPNSTQGGTLVQLVDLSTHPDFGTTNYMTVLFSMNSHLWCGTRVDMIMEYLPASYNGTTVTVDDPVWSEADDTPYTYYATTRTGWRTQTRTYTGTIPAVRWIRVKFVFDVTWDDDSDFDNQDANSSDYYIAVDQVSLDVEMFVPETPCTDNLLTNPGFESATGDVPDDWYVLDGRMTHVDVNDVPLLPAYNGAGYAGNIGGTVIDGVDNPVTPQNGNLVQLVDLSTLTGFSDASFITFNFSLFYMNQRVESVGYTVEYLPESYNESAVTWDDAAWDSDAVTAVTDENNNTSGNWYSIAVGPGSLPVVRWVRVRLDIDSQLTYSSHVGQYLGGFDQVCLQAEAVVVGELIQNPSFEDQVDSKPTDWYEDADGGPAWIAIEPPPAKDGAYYLAKPLIDGQEATTRVYQVIDLADRIPGWTSINPDGGTALERRFIQMTLNALVTNIGGTSVKVGLEYLPYSYNTIDGIVWDNEAWEPRDWTSDGSAFTNNGGDAIDLGALIEDTTVSTDPLWREVAYDGWLPRVRWIRLRIEMDATLTEGMGFVGIDAMSLSAACTTWGPYSGFGNLPEATFYEDPDAPDPAIPAWVGPEGDGISGGYTGQTEQNYVNPLFAGFADNYVNYIPSGENIYNELFMEPMAITGSPWNDAGWVYVIVTMGDLGLTSLADYYGLTPSGTYQPGEITATFDECPIVNGPGPDFATFENGFSAGWTTPEIFAELAYVEVSSNGTDFIRFPTHSLTPYWPGAYGTIYATGVFGLTGKHINAYGDQWGTPFDLDWIADDPLVLNGTVDLNNIRYVRQVDMVGGGPQDASGASSSLGITGFCFDSYGNVIFDSWPTWGSGGADLDAVAVINTSATDSDGDNIVDYWDNCPQTSNETQYDTDEDGYGNACDCDIDGDEGGDGTVNLLDYLVLKEAFGSTGPIMIPGEPGEDNTYADASENWNADADFNGDLEVNLLDYLIFKERFGSSVPFE
ncbi:dockerin type I domain-containing protein [uncultured Desulfosarcina sp.]|uniref:dockerin type I domain-containing protein n=1 Tax=uncultured Desulfosarcina sp. TaxID=218289 RepID=UPI0029C938D1|nr:dockerin type I domain-containing protein [uncultured Desulfosarcina sp.]